ncbi:EMBRYO DEFECTIVE 140 [Wolffia australiana]
MAGGGEEDDAEMLESSAGEGDEAASDQGKSDASSSSDSEPDEAAENEQIAALEKAVQENPANYDAHVQYIACLRKYCHTEKLRQARKSMSDLFPMSPEMWREWAKDEITLNPGVEAIPIIEDIYEKGVHEYLSIPLWLDYLRFVEEHDQSVAQCAPVGVSKMRNLYERAISAAGLHVPQGNKIWDAYREFEEAVLLTIDDSNGEAKEKQINCVRALFHRQLSIPLAGMDSTFIAYKEWDSGLANAREDSSESDVVPKSVGSAYQKAFDMYHALESYEKQLSDSSSSDSDRLQHFMSYITFEDSSGHPARVQVLYERAVSEFPISSDLWLNYTRYMDKTLKIASVLKNVYSRATRNCSWIGSLWVQYLLSLERVGASEKELLEVFERSLQCSFSSFNEYLDLFLTRVDGLRRRLSSSATRDDAVDHSLINATLERAVEYLSLEQIGTEDSLRLYDYWARLEIGLGSGLTSARGVWESLLKKSGAVLEYWKGFIDMEIRLGNTKEARSIYKRCYSKKFAGNGSEDICHSWLRFEREFGSLEDYDLAMKKVAPRLKELNLFKIQEAASKSIVFQPPAQSDSVASKPPSKKRKPADAPKEKPFPPKKQKNLTEEDSKKPDTFYTDQCTAFVSNLSLEAKEGHLREFFGPAGGVTAVRLVKDKFTGRPKGFAYVDFADEEHLNTAVAKNRQWLLGKKASVARSDPKKPPRSGGGRGTAPSRRVDRGRGHVEFQGSATFAMPRSVRPLGWAGNVTGPAAVEEEPKSNAQFREMLAKK